MGLSWADLLHGPIAVVDANTPAIIVAADRPRAAGQH
jgi:glucosamine--fructose-6-phosphate aminotransferase (isomerizing)